MEIDQIGSNDKLIYRNVGLVKFGENGLGQAIIRQRDDTIDVLKVVDWFPYVGVWLLVKGIPNYKMEKISLNVTCSSNPNLTSVISLVQPNEVFSEAPNLEGYQLWFATFISSFPFVLEINTHEKIINNAEMSNMVSTLHERFIYPYKGIFGRKTYFHVPSPNITYNSPDFYDSIQIEYGIHFFISLGYFWKVIPLNKNIRAMLNNVVLSDKRFSGDMASPWNWGEFISEHQTYVFIPPIYEDKSVLVAPPALFGTVSCKYKGALIMSKDLNSVVNVHNLLKDIIRNSSQHDRAFLDNYENLDVSTG